jgi:5-methyltetrahydrofolate--homocysteine methyltransferase
MLAETGYKPAHSAVIGTVEGDLHDIGKNLVAMMWKGANFEVIDLGVNVSPATFVQAVEEHQPDIVGMSALLTTTMPRMRTAIEAVKASGVPVKIMVGGAPVTPEFAAEVGADGFAPDAASAVDVALDLVAG